MFSSNGEYQLIMQGDGNLVEYFEGRALWDSGTQGNPGAWAAMQGDGNLCIYGASVLWCSGTQGNAGASLALQNDANLVVYSQGGVALWVDGAVNDRLTSGQTLHAGQTLQSTSRSYQLAMQGDGNLCSYNASGVPLWCSGTQNNPGAWVAMQGDGNLCIYGASALWCSGTQGNAGAWAVQQGDANFVVYSGGTALWDDNVVVSGVTPGGTNDYPYPSADNGQVDQWDFFVGQCTSFAAWRLNHNDHIPFSNSYKGVHWGNAYQWAAAAESVGIPVNGTPTVGSIAVYPSSLPGSGGSGHVAFVESVNSSAGTVTLEEYNFTNSQSYDQRTQSISALGVQYIHFVS